jgi:hypothetical protein
MMEAEELIAHVDRGTIEVAPLAYMRGRTLNDAFIVLDEAQNTTRRADEDVPDPHRVQLQGGGHRRRQPGRPAQRGSGRGCGRRGDPRRDRGRRLRRLRSGDVVRHHIVQRIVEAYEAYDEAQEEPSRSGAEAVAAGSRGELTWPSTSPTSRTEGRRRRPARASPARARAPSASPRTWRSRCCWSTRTRSPAERHAPGQGRPDRRAGLPDRRTGGVPAGRAGDPRRRRAVPAVATSRRPGFGRTPTRSCGC